ncbi:hypothetical protein V8C86DRAFT_3002927 [Haematococcus lacustris]
MNGRGEDCDGLLDRIESYFCSPRFLSAVGGFMGENASKLVYETQPIHNHELFTKYTAIIDEHMKDFIYKNGVSAQAVYAACQAAQSSQETSISLVCLDYLMAALDYDAFIELAREHHEMALEEAGTDMEASSEPEEECGSTDEDHATELAVPVHGFAQAAGALSYAQVGSTFAYIT